MTLSFCSKISTSPIVTLLNPSSFPFCHLITLSPSFLLLHAFLLISSPNLKTHSSCCNLRKKKSHFDFYSSAITLSFPHPLHYQTPGKRYVCSLTKYSTLVSVHDSTEIALVRSSVTSRLLNSLANLNHLFIWVLSKTILLTTLSLKHCTPQTHYFPFHPLWGHHLLNHPSNVRHPRVPSSSPWIFFWTLSSTTMITTIVSKFKTPIPTHTQTCIWNS